MQTFNLILYLMAVLTCLACTVLLGRSYLHTGMRLLLWGTLCFVGLSISNVLLFFDLIVFPASVDLRALLADRARSRGVTRVTVSAYCTRCDNDRLFSHRAGDSGRQLGVIVAAR